ncbi:diphthamide synthase NDAI_0F02100 [Naumovozyma dairenensis CBS 421]|uniref:methylated diphthine methylhydrolase n=1 Tax=Naumovozyma dairenensis (strain ATCC 10597 / BCRC 20456 / CBS 421 / NBRC 0211 / NRRL Y-12639) TaxID=1071378 RepID=G0WCL7_NAUDC|nr:hypothetical protein NDAI_0F02100 [Naumovozyma dairenensis CBS 421]CCD25528.1 hypothetical protein NDAI_0F02100 [Naumovozyma dairenensis CBS 421]
MEESKVLACTKLKYPPCCLQIFKNNGKKKRIILGTYELNKETGYRVGTLDLLDEDLQLITSQDTYGAVLDLKLNPFDNSLLASGHSTGNIMLWKVSSETDELVLLSNLQIFETDKLVTSLHWSPLVKNFMMITNTAGEMATIDIETQMISSFNSGLSSTSTHVDTLTWKEYEVQGKQENAIACFPDTFTGKHGLECWTAEFGVLSPFENVVFTGGDDATIMAHDLRSKGSIWSNNRIHEAGVVGIKCSTPTFRSNRPMSLITGSYDDYIRSFDLRMLGDNIYPGDNIPVAQLSSRNLGGGVWRFSNCPTNGDGEDMDKLLVCCMYDGAKIVSIDESNNGTEDYFLVSNYLKTGHESMCYGGDWDSDFIATCSFYDKSVQKWNP